MAEHTTTDRSGPTADAPAYHNPYLGHRQLTEQEAQVLGEYHRLSQTLRRVVQVSNRLSATKQHAQTLDELRMTERKMGLVLTLYQASVFSIVLDQEEKQRLQEEARRLMEEEEERGQVQGYGDGDDGRRAYDDDYRGDEDRTFTRG